MTRAYSNDLRQRVVDAVLEGASCAAASEQFGVSKSSAIKWVRLFHRTGSVAPGKMGGHRPILLEPYRDFILEQLEHRPRPYPVAPAGLAGRARRESLSRYCLAVSAPRRTKL